MKDVRNLIKAAKENEFFFWWSESQEIYVPDLIAIVRNIGDMDKRLAFLTVALCGLCGRLSVDPRANDDWWAWMMPPTIKCVESFLKVKKAYKLGYIEDIISTENITKENENGDIVYSYQKSLCTIDLETGQVVVQDENIEGGECNE